MLAFVIAKHLTFINGSPGERAEFCKKMQTLGFKTRERNGYSIIDQENIRSISENHITVHQDNGTRITWGKSAPQKILEAMRQHNRNGYIRYKHRNRDYHQSVKRGTIYRPTELYETWHWNEPWFPLSPKLEGWVQIVQF